MKDEYRTFAKTFDSLSNKLYSWLLFIILSLTWGSSFILMKLGLESLNAYQVAAIRVLSAGIVLLPFAFKSYANIPKQKMGYVVLSGLLGSFFPAFLYCIAETRIDSGIAGILNALTPVCAIIIGISFFDLTITRGKIIGVAIGFAGLVLLPFAGNRVMETKDLSYAALVLIATICYGLNVNLVSRHLKQIKSLHIASVAFAFLIIPCCIILGCSGFFGLDFTNTQILHSISMSALLGISGTAVATILFYMLVKKAGAIFASLVTYGIPFIAIMWGVIFKEEITLLQIGCLGIILGGVYLVNKS